MNFVELEAMIFMLLKLNNKVIGDDVSTAKGWSYFVNYFTLVHF